MYQSTAVIVVAALVAAVPVGAAAQVAGPAPRVTSAGVRAAAPAQASIGGRVVTPNGQVLVNTGVRARDLLTGTIAGSTSTAAGGQFSIVGLNPGNYVLEIVDAGGQVIGTSSFIFASAGASVATTVTATSAAASAVNTVTGLAASSHVNRRGERQVCGGRSRRRRHGHTRKRGDGQSVPVSRSDTTGLREGSSP